MTEAEWLAGTDPQKMLTFFVVCQESDRKRRLFAVACCRSVAHLMADCRSRDAVAAAERYADGLIDEAALASARSAAALAAQQAWSGGPAAGTAGGAAVVAAEGPFAWTAAGMAGAAAGIAAKALERSAGRPDRAAVAAEAPAAQADLVREVFGNPWRPPALAAGPSPRACAGALAIARRAYVEGDFLALPVLADALEDAGVTNPDILGHLRGPGPHVRGCWAVDLLLGKE
jgi:hypothetical protein